jgi:hypothetical protein
LLDRNHVMDTRTGHEMEDGEEWSTSIKALRRQPYKGFRKRDQNAKRHDLIKSNCEGLIQFLLELESVDSDVQMISCSLHYVHLSIAWQCQGKSEHRELAVSQVIHPETCEGYRKICQIRGCSDSQKLWG